MEEQDVHVVHTVDVEAAAFVVARMNEPEHAVQEDVTPRAIACE